LAQSISDCPFQKIWWLKRLKYKGFNYSCSLLFGQKPLLFKGNFGKLRNLQGFRATTAPQFLESAVSESTLSVFGHTHFLDTPMWENGCFVLLTKKQNLPQL